MRETRKPLGNISGEGEYDAAIGLGTATFKLSITSKSRQLPPVPLRTWRQRLFQSAN